MPTTRVAEILREHGSIVFPGVYDTLSARIVERVGFPMSFVSGYSVAATAIGEPDMGLLTQTEIVERPAAVLCTRRPRSPEEATPWLFAMMAVHTVRVAGAGEPKIGTISHETDRARFIGRGRDLQSPQALDAGGDLSNTAGSVLDPIAASRCLVTLAPDQAVTIDMVFGMGETREDRCDLAFELKAIGANVVPVNILNPIPGTPFAKLEPLPVMEILKTIACFRFILPRQEIMIAGGRTVNLRDAQSMIFMAGASALMVGNYLTTLNQPVEKDLQMLKDLGLDPNWDSHDFSDQEEGGCGCGKESCETASAIA